MAPIVVDPAKVRTFKNADAFYKWLSKNHDKHNELWIKIHKVGSGLKSITPKEAIDVVLSLRVGAMSSVAVHVCAVKGTLARKQAKMLRRTAANLK